MTILNLGRLGDHINLLPVAYANKGTTFVTAAKYADIFEGVHYCQTRNYSGDPVELHHAINLCQGLPDLRVAQVFMHPKETKQESNYALESYRLGRFRDLWRKHPYVFDRRNPEREQKLIPEGPFIAVAPHGVSSPFANSKQLINGLQSRFPEYMHIVQCRAIDDCIKSWEQIAPTWPNKRCFYGEFVSKWIISPVPNRMIVYYHDLLDDAEVWVNKVISFIK